MAITGQLQLVGVKLGSSSHALTVAPLAQSFINVKRSERSDLKSDYFSEWYKQITERTNGRFRAFGNQIRIRIILY